MMTITDTITIAVITIAVITIAVITIAVITIAISTIAISTISPGSNAHTYAQNLWEARSRFPRKI
jgi:hypothetical protein